MGLALPSLYHITSWTLSANPPPMLDVGISSHGIVASRPTAVCTSDRGPGMSKETRDCNQFSHRKSRGQRIDSISVFNGKVANHANQHLIRLIDRPGTIARVMVAQSPAKKTQRSVALHFLGQPHAMATNCNPPSGLCTNKWGEPTKITVLMQLRDQTCLICGNLWEMQMPTNSHPSTRRLTRLLPTMQCSYIQTRHTNGHR